MTFGTIQAATTPGAGKLQGRIEDAATRIPIANAAVKLTHGAQATATTTSDATGRFTFDAIAEGVYSVEVEVPAYLKAVQPGVRVVLNKSVAVDFALVHAISDDMQEVVVSARAPDRDPLATPSVVLLDREEIRRNPGSTSDVFRALDMLPGVVATGEFSSFTVRGNGPRDNLIMVDGFPFDQVVHFDESVGEEQDVAGGGRYSIFAPNLIGSARFTPGAWRASEDGKFGSLLQLEVARGSKESSTLATQLDFGGLEASYEGSSYVADNTSVLFSARSFDFSTLLEAIEENDVGIPRLTDLIFKSTTEVSDAHRIDFLAIHATEDYERNAEHVLQSENFEDVSIAESDQASSLFGVTWNWSLGGSSQLRNAFYYRHNDKSSSQGESYPDQAGPDPTADDIPVRPDIFQLAQKESEYGWRSDFSTTFDNGAMFTAGARVASIDLDYDRRLNGDWIRYAFDDSDFRPDPSQHYVVLTPEDVDSRLSAREMRYAAYADYSFPIGAVTITPGIRFERDGFADQSLFSPRLQAVWKIDDASQAWLGGGVYYQSPPYLDMAADPANAQLQNEQSNQFSVGYSRDLAAGFRFTAEAYHYRLSDLIVIDDRTTQVGVNTGEGTASGVDLMLMKRMSNRWSATATYSYSRARRDDNLGEGEYASDFDRPHAFGLLAAWEPSDRWSFSAKWRYASGVPGDGYVTYDDVLAGAPVPYMLRYSRETIATNVTRLPAFHSLTLRADYHRRFGPVNVIAFLDFINVYGRKNTESLEWDERRGVNVLEGMDEPLPYFGVKFEYSWTRN